MKYSLNKGITWETVILHFLANSSFASSEG